MADDELVLEERHDAVALLTLNRPKALNALSRDLMGALLERLGAIAADDGVNAVVLTGAGRAFAAGADVPYLSEATAVQMFMEDRIGAWDRVYAFPKPLIAAVHGFALGGGCELAMICDITIAADDAQFGQPETNLGIIPGAGGTQRTPRAIGKSLTMEMVLAGRTLSAAEALAHGLVSRVVAREALLPEALALATSIASRSPVATRLARDSVRRAYETTLETGIAYERRALEIAFASEDAREGMRAFLEKRSPTWKGT